MLNRTLYAVLIADARSRDEEEEARQLEAEYNYLRAEECASKERARQRTIARKREAAWMAGVEAQGTSAELPKGLTDYERRAWLAGVGGFQFDSLA
jgi:hypothetical protein